MVGCLVGLVAMAPATLVRSGKGGDLDGRCFAKTARALTFGAPGCSACAQALGIETCGTVYVERRIPHENRAKFDLVAVSDGGRVYEVTSVWRGKLIDFDGHRSG